MYARSEFIYIRHSSIGNVNFIRCAPRSVFSIFRFSRDTAGLMSRANFVVGRGIQ